MTALELLTTLRDRGVRLTPNVTTVRVEAPAGVLTDVLRAAIRTHKTVLLDLLEAFEERRGDHGIRGWYVLCRGRSAGLVLCQWRVCV